jgi:aldehyde:ferredoxin oxidoreductase
MATSFKGGYLGKILRINLTTRAVTVQEISDTWNEKLLGGRGIAAKIYHDEIGPEVTPFDAENKVILMAGPLTGLKLPAATKFQLSTKGPETGGYLCSNCSGKIGTQLKKSGYDGMVLEGACEDWTYLTIKNGEVDFHDGRSMKGNTTGEAIEKLYAAIGSDKASALTIGPAGENLVKISYVSVDHRAFGRGGAGAVFGAKKLKGIAVLGSGDIPVADAAKVDEIRIKAYKNLRETRGNHTKYGTAQYIEPINELGCMPTRNFQTTHFEGGEKVNHLTLFKEYRHGNAACNMCPVACGMVAEVKDGPYKGAIARTEFESIGLLGPNCGIDDFGAVVAANQYCDEYGIDTMSGANMVALAMELYVRGLIGKEETGGIDATFGNPAALLGLLKLIAERKAIGDLLAEGMLGVEKAHPEWSPYILHVKGMSLAAYDPRGFYGNGLTYGTSSRGACHNVGGWTIRAELQSGQYDRFAVKGKGELVHSIQDNRAYVDSLGICTVVRGSMDFSADPKGETMEAATGYPFTEKLLEIGNRIYSLERVILNREGNKREQDKLPPRIVNEAVPSGPIKGQRLTREMYDEMLDEYYVSRGWDNEGVVTEETIDKTGLKEFVG